MNANELGLQLANEVIAEETGRIKTFKNLHYNSKQVHQCTAVAFCAAQTAPAPNWVECDSAENNMDHLYTQGGVRYFGRL